jgi:hypothetical protein
MSMKINILIVFVFSELYVALYSIENTVVGDALSCTEVDIG